MGVSRDKGFIKFFIFTIILLVMCFFFMFGCCSAPIKPEKIVLGNYESTIKYLCCLIEKEMKKFRVTGLSIALIDNQHIVWAQGFGYADKSNKIAATPETLYRAGSISKLFTATATMQLVEQNKIYIDRPLQAYLPEFSIKTHFIKTKPITLRNIMTHHSGLPGDFLKDMWSKKSKPFTTLVKHVRNQYAAYPPNYVFSYSNLAVTLLGHAIEKVSGENFASYMDKLLLEPLGMVHSSFSQKDDKSSLMAKGYRKGKEAEEISLRDLPAGGLNSSVLELSRFIQMVFADGKSGERQIIKPETLTEMLRPQNTDIALDLDFRIGLGWILSNIEGIDNPDIGAMACHNGATMLFHSQLLTLPEHKLGVVVMSNSSSARGVVDKAAIEALKLALEVKAGIKVSEYNKSKDVYNSIPPILDDYEGYYATPWGLAKVIKKRKSLRAELMNTTFRLVPRSDGQLVVKYKLFGVIPISLGFLDNVGISRAVIAERDIILTQFGDKKTLFAEKIKPLPISEKWMQRLGKYEITNQGKDIILFDNMSLCYEDKILKMKYDLPLFIKGKICNGLSPISDTEAIIYGLGRGKGETIRVIEVDGVEMLEYSGYLLSKEK